jgi:hypothetical protein
MAKHRAKVLMKVLLVGISNRKKVIKKTKGNRFKKTLDLFGYECLIQVDKGIKILFYIPNKNSATLKQDRLYALYPSLSSLTRSNTGDRSGDS